MTTSSFLMLVQHIRGSNKDFFDRYKMLITTSNECDNEWYSLYCILTTENCSIEYK